jgi:exodeoxyribonuclease III
MPDSSAKPVAPHHEHDQLKLMTWNVQHASAARALRQVAWIASQPVDVAVLTEVPAARGHDAIAQALAGHGFTTFGPPGSGTDYRTLIAVRVGSLEPWPHIHTGHLPHRCAAARLHVGSRQVLGVVGLYVPSRGNQARRNVDKRAFQDAVTAILPNLRESFADADSIVIAGDLNVVEPGHRPAHAVFGRWEYSFYRAFQDAGFIDAYRHVRPNEHQYSWYGRSGAGYRFDHIFVSDPDLIADCYYDHSPRDSGLSDHSAMMLRASLIG